MKNLKDIINESLFDSDITDNLSNKLNDIKDIIVAIGNDYDNAYNFINILITKLIKESKQYYLDQEYAENNDLIDYLNKSKELTQNENDDFFCDFTFKYNCSLNITKKLNGDVVIIQLFRRGDGEYGDSHLPEVEWVDYSAVKNGSNECYVNFDSFNNDKLIDKGKNSTEKTLAQFFIDEKLFFDITNYNKLDDIFNYDK
jgi:hypothetical protein